MITKIKCDDREKWLALRKRYIGGSDAAAVVGMNPFSSPFALWAEKTGKVPGFEGNLATDVGAYLEEFIAQRFAKETGKKVRRCNFSLINGKYWWAIADIDRDIVGEDAGLECKSTSALSLKRFKNGEYPENYYVQCVHYLAVTGKARWYLAVLIGNSDFRVYTIERDEEEIAALMEAERNFKEKYVDADQAPPVDGQAATTSAVKTIYADSSDEAADLSSCKAALSEYMTLTGRIRELERLRDEKANEIKLCMGDAARGTDGCYKVAWPTASRSSFDAKRFAAEHREIDLTPYYRQSAYRTFKVTEAGRQDI